jgi:predicted nucleic acid-binding Zn ribbon protein
MNSLVPQKNCIICNVAVPEPEWIQHLKSSTHKNNTQLFLQKLKDKLPPKNCIICNAVVPDHEWIQHLKSSIGTGSLGP